MAKIGTKELFDDYYKDKSDDLIKKVRPQVDRPEVYAYEEKIGKQLVEMDVDELFEMINTFKNNRRGSEDSYHIAYSSYMQIASVYRNIFNFYIDNYEIIRNPWNDSRMRGTAASARLSETRKGFSFEELQEIIGRIHNSFNTPMANYYECILLLYYSGFAEAKEITLMMEEDIDFEKKEVKVGEKIVHLSDRCMEMLQYVHNLEVVEGYRVNYIVEPYHGSYFKFIIFPKEKMNFQQRNLTEVSNVINRRISIDINKNLGTSLNYRLLYNLGFYDCLVKEYGKDRTQELILSVRNSEDAHDLMVVAKKYGIRTGNVTIIKKNLRPFLN